MDCRRYQNALNEEAAGMFAPERKRALDAHLTECAACAARLERRRKALAAIDAALMQSAELEPSPELMAGVESRLAERDVTAARPWLSIRVAAAAAAVVALVVAWAVWSRFSSPLQTPNSAMIDTVPLEKTEAKQVPTEAHATKPGGTAETHTARAERLGVRHATTKPAARHGQEAAIAGMKIPAEKAAVVKLYEFLGSGDVNGQSLVRAEEAAAKPLKVAPLEIEPLAISPLEATRETANPEASGPPNELRRK
jgi:predicted anti-sigma-YlaC factor YlaD